MIRLLFQGFGDRLILAELGVVIGRPCKNVNPGGIVICVGVCLLNDVSADCKGKGGGQFCRGKTLIPFVRWSVP